MLFFVPLFRAYLKIGGIAFHVDLTNWLLCFLSLFSSEMSGTGEDISQVHWKQQWLDNGTLYFHVSMTESELLEQATQPTAREPAHALHEHMHLLHISVMVSYKYWETMCTVYICGYKYNDICIHLSHSNAPPWWFSVSLLLTLRH